MLSPEKAKDLYKQGYRLVGGHSAVKSCMWAKKALIGQGHCYKQEFYDTKSHRCVQMTPALNACTHRCVWCWRDIEYTHPKWIGKADDPKLIVEGAIKENTKYLRGFGGNKKTDWKKYEELAKPQQFAISLSGEPTLYPKLPELILELNKKKINSFLVTNGTAPNMLKTLLEKKARPTQLYVTLPAPDQETYLAVCRPLIKEGWKKIMKSLSLLKKFKRSVIRLTLVKNINMIKPDLYAQIIKKYSPQFVECKAYMWVGYSQHRLDITNMPYHHDIMEFARELAKFSGFHIKDEKKESRVVLLSRRKP